jgi:hypothetical protein
MAKLQKIVTIEYVYEYQLTDEEYQQYLEDEEKFMETFDEDEAFGDLLYEDVDSVPTEINLIED